MNEYPLIEFPLEKNEQIFHTFLGHVYCKPKNDNTLDLQLLVKEFPLDVTVNESNTEILQGSNLVDKSFEICSTRFKNKKINYEPVGFIKKSFPRNPDTMEYSYPPNIIPIGCYCTECDSVGPYLHLDTCSKPKKTSLFFTMDGLIDSLFVKKNKIITTDTELIDKINKLVNFVNNTEKGTEKNTKKNVEKMIDKEKIKKIIIEQLNLDNDKYTTIPISLISNLTKKDTGQFFSGPVMIKFKKSDGDVTIRIRSDSTIELISNPWSNKELYVEIIKRINKTSQKVSLKGMEIRSFFSSVNMFKKESNQFGSSVGSSVGSSKQFGTSSKQFDITKVFDYFWPSDKNNCPISTGPKEEMIVNNKVIYFIRSKNNMYNYYIHRDKFSKNRLYTEFITINKDKKGISFGPYKINTQLFSQGHLQVTFGYYKNANVTENMDDQFSTVKQIINDIHDLFLHHLSIMIRNDETSVTNVAQKQISKKIYETICGSIPYAKKKKFKVGDNVQEFLVKKMKWSSKIGEIVEIYDTNDTEKVADKEIENENNSDILEKDIYSGKFYKVKYTKDTKKEQTKEKSTKELKKEQKEKSTKEIKNIIYKNIDQSLLRTLEKNNDQVCRLRENGVLKQPVPYSFLYPVCPGGLGQIVKPIGVVSRTDNRQYPFCSDIKKDDDEWVVNFLINGLNKEERRMGFIKNTEVDNFCGVFTPGTASLGSCVIANIDGKWKNVKILDKYKTHGLGNDKIVVIYKVCLQDDTSQNSEFEITGEQFHSSYIENRNYEGFPRINGKLDEETAKNLLITCAKKLNIIKNSESLGSLESLASKSLYSESKLLISKNSGSKKMMSKLLSKKDIDYIIINKYTCFVLPEVLQNLEECYITTKVNKIVVKKSNYEKEIEVDDNFFNGVKNTKEFTINGYVDKNNVFYLGSKRNLNKFMKIYNRIASLESTGLIFPKPDYFTENDTMSFIKRRIVIDPVYVYDIKNTIIFSPSDPELDTFVYSDKKIRSVVVQLVSNKDGKWTCGLLENGKCVLELGDIVCKFDDEKKLEKNGEKNGAKIGDFLSIKPNVMLDGTLNPNTPILDQYLTNETKFVGIEKTKMILDHILYPINPMFFVEY
jgi:hypothetical protein